MTAFTANFGVKTRVGYGGFDVAEVEGSAITGTGSDDWYINAQGHIVPGVASAAGTYGAAKTFSKAATETYSLTLASGDTIVITMVANRADAMSTPADTGATGGNQFNAYLTTAYTDTARRLLVGDTIYLRDGFLYTFMALNENVSIPAGGYAGFGTIAPGTGYSTGTYPTLAATTLSGSGVNVRLRVVVTGGGVANVHVDDPGTGVQTGDTFTASVPGGSGFVFTAGANFASKITVRSDTPNATTDATGNLRRGGSATFRCVSFLASNQPYLRIPVQFQDVDFIWASTATHTRTFFIGYRNENGNSVGATNCYFAVDASIPIATSGVRIRALMARLGALFNENRIYRCRRVTEVDGIGAYVAASNTIPLADNTVLRRTIRDNVISNCNGDTILIGGTKSDVIDNTCFDYEVYTGEGTPHQDGIQHGGFGLLGTTLTDVAYVDGNVIYRGVGNAAQGIPQAIIFTDTDPPTQQTGITFVNNLTVSGSTTGLTIPACIGPQVLRNTSICLVSWPDGANEGNARIFLKQGTGGLVDRNITNKIYINEPGEPAQTGCVTTAENLETTDKSGYANIFHAPATGLKTRAAIIAAFKAKLDGTAKNADGTYNGAFFPDGTKNDGTVYQSTPPTSITQSANVATVEINGAVVITYQLDAAANQSVTVTPGASGVTGAFSAATAVIAVGEASAQLTFTPTSAGTATLSAADDRSLTGPSNITVTVTAAASSAPTAYTQVADRSSVTLSGAIEITYTLNAVATTPVVITPAVSGVSGSFSQPTVTIPFGQTAGQVAFFPSTLGTGSLTATDDQSLTDPNAIAFTVTACTAAQLVVLGMR